MKLHLPLFLRKALLAACCVAFAVSMNDEARADYSLDFVRYEQSLLTGSLTGNSLYVYSGAVSDFYFNGSFFDSLASSVAHTTIYADTINIWGASVSITDSQFSGSVSITASSISKTTITAGTASIVADRVNDITFESLNGKYVDADLRVKEATNIKGQNVSTLYLGYFTEDSFLFNNISIQNNDKKGCLSILPTNSVIKGVLELSNVDFDAHSQTTDLRQKRQLFENVSGYIQNANSVKFLGSYNAAWSDGCSLLKFGEDGFVLSNNKKISVGNNDVSSNWSYLYCNENFSYLIHSQGAFSILDNTTVEISGNILKGDNAAALFFAAPSQDLVISGNDKVKFSLNIADSGTTLPYAIKGTGKCLYLNTSTYVDSSIRFYQPISWTGNVELNKYEKVIGKGEILFSGAEIDSYLTQQSGYLSNEDRIKARTSLIEGDVTLYNGTLEIRDSATLNITPIPICNADGTNSSGTLTLEDNAKMYVDAAILRFIDTYIDNTALHTVNFTLNKNSELHIDFSESYNKSSANKPIIKVDECLTYVYRDANKSTIYISDVEWGADKAIALLSANNIKINNNYFDEELEFDDSNWMVKYSDEKKVKASVISHPEIKINDKADLYYSTSSKIGKNTFTYESELLSEWIGNTLYLYKPTDEQWLTNLSTSILKSKAKNQKIEASQGYSPSKTWRGDEFQILDTDKLNVIKGGNGGGPKGKYDDKGLCWIYTAANIIQYWQDKYAPLYQGDEALITNRRFNSTSELVANEMKKLNQAGGDVGAGIALTLDFWFNGKGFKVAKSGKVVFYDRDEPKWWHKFEIASESTDVSILGAKDFYNKLSTMLQSGEAPVAVGYEWEVNGETSRHVITCWGVDLIDEETGLLALYCTDSDSEPLDNNTSSYSTKYVIHDGNSLRLMGSTDTSTEPFETRNPELCALMGIEPTSHSSMSSLLAQVANPDVPMYWTGKASNSAWKARSSVKDGDEFHLADAADGWKKKVDNAKDIWAHAYFIETAGNTGCIYDNLVAHQTSFIFSDEVDGVALTAAQKQVNLPKDLTVKSVEVKGKDYIFSGKGRLTATHGIKVTGNLAIQDQMQVKDTAITVSGGTMNAYRSGSTTISGGAINLTFGGKLWCAGFELDKKAKDGAINLNGNYISFVESSVNSSISSDGSGSLGAYVDFNGYPVITLNSSALSQMFYDKVGATGGMTQFNYMFMPINAITILSASDIEKMPQVVAGSDLTLKGTTSKALSIGSFSVSSDETKSSISVSEILDSIVTAESAQLATVGGEKSYFGAGTQITAPQLTVSAGSELMNDGRIGGGTIQVANQAVLGGSGRFGTTRVQAGGTLVVGNSPGAPVYESLTLAAGANLVFSLDGAEAATAEKNGWGSGTHSLLTVTGNLDIATGTAVKVGCSLDFLNASALGETQTLTLIQLSGNASNAMLSALQSGTEFMWADDDTLAALTEVGAGVRDVRWSQGDGYTLQLSFTVSSMPEGALRWTNAGGNGVWDAATQNWQDSSGGIAAFTAGKSVLFYTGGTVQLQGELIPGTVVVSTPQDVVFTGSGSLTGDGELHKESSGALRIETENSYTGGTTLLGGSLTAAHAYALGLGSVRLRGGELIIAADGVEHYISAMGENTLTVQDGYTLSLVEPIYNEGTLTINGTLDVSALAPDLAAEGGKRVDAYGTEGEHGFLDAGGGSVVVVEGDGTVLGSNATVLANGLQLTLGTDGVASTGGGVSYASYMIGKGHSIPLSFIVEKAAAHGCNSTAIELQEGMLTADCALTGQLRSSGESIIIASDWQQNRVISNSGTLRISGNIIADALQLHTGESVRIGLDGTESSSGFEKSGDSSVVLVEGGTVVDAGLTVTHSGKVLTLGTNGVATLAGSLDKSRYLLSGAAAVSASAIHAQSAQATVAMDGGVLTADESATVNATGGEIKLSAGTLSGSISGAKLGISGGTLTATLTGSNTLSGNNKLSNVLNNAGTLSISGTLDVTAVGALMELADAYTEGGNNGFRVSEVSGIKLVENSGTINSSATITHGSNTLTLGNNGIAMTAGTTDYSTYYINNGHTATVSDIIAQSGNKLSLIDMTGGTLNANATAKADVSGGNVNLSVGTLSGSINGAKLSISGGKLTATLTGSNTLSGSNKLSNVLNNAGTLSISGTLDVSAVGSLIRGASTYTEGGNNGFRTAGDYSIKLVENSGTINSNATIKHGGISLTLGSNGIATAAGETDYSTYYITAGHAVMVSDIIVQSGSKLSLIDMTGGTLNANSSAKVDVSGGNVNLSAGTLSGSISGAQLSISGGKLTATLTGSNTLSGNNKLSNVLNNVGTLSISGTLDVSGVGALNCADVTYTEGGSNGFRTAGDYSIKLVENSGTINNSATIKHGSIALTLGSNGIATAAGETDYSTYYITAGHIAKVSDIIAQSGAELKLIDIAGGTLTADDDAKVAATGGHIRICDDATLSGSLNNTKLTLEAGDYQATLQSSIAGNSSVTVSGGAVLMSADNSYDGGTVLHGGSLRAGHANALGSGKVMVTGGTLDLGGYAVSNNIEINGIATLRGASASNGMLNLKSGELSLDAAHKGHVLLQGGTLKNTATAASSISTGDVTLSGAALSGDFTLAGSNSWIVETETSIDGTLSLGGQGELSLLNHATLNVDGTLNLDNFTLNLTGKYEAGESYTLMEADSIRGGVDGIVLNGVKHYTLSTEGGKLMLQMAQPAIYWSNTKKTVWQVGAAGWHTAEGEARFFEDGNIVTIDQGTITIVGKVAPSEVYLTPEKSLTLKSDKKNPGTISGDAAVIIAAGAKGKVTMNESNTYSGGTTIESGTVNAKGTSSFGKGEITLTGGTLNLASKTMNNAITLNGAATIKGGKKYAGVFTMTGGELMKGSQLNLMKDLTLSGGIINGTLTGTAMVSVAGDVILGDNGKMTINKLNIEEGGKLSVGAKGLTMKADGNLLTLAGGELESAGKLNITTLRMTEGGELSIYNAKGAQSLTLSSKTATNRLEDSLLDISGSMTVANDLRTSNTDIILKDKVKGKQMGLTAKGRLTMENESSLELSGKLNLAALTMTDSSILLREPSKPQTITLSRKDAKNQLLNSELYANASMTTAGNLWLDNSHIKLWDASAKNKAMNLNIKGDLDLKNGSSLTLSGALTTLDLTLTGGTLNLTSSKVPTVRINGTLTITGENDLNLGFSVSAGDVQKGKVFTLMTFKKTYLTDRSDLHGLLGLDDDFCILTLDEAKTALQLTVTDWEAWNDYVNENKQEWQQATKEQAPLTTTATPEEAAAEDDSTQAPATTTTTATAEADAALVKVSDTLVQSTWGAAKASRAFVDSIGKRWQNATALDAAGRGAAWGAALGATARLSSHGGHNGADYNLSGAAFGVETAATGKHSVGLAIGSTWGKVSTLSAYTVDQDSTHVALYGQSHMGKNLSLDWSAAYGRSENEADLLGAGYDWTQHSVQLDARLSYGVALNERTTARAFAGLQYQYVDSATPTAGVEADSLSNLRAEIGVGASYAATAKTSVYGEVSFIGDMVRDNPAGHIGGECHSGANPGRAGMNLSVGATHALNESWSVNAGYTLELVPHATGHNANIGATYRF